MSKRMKQMQLTTQAETTTYLKMERSQSQEWLDKAMKKQIAAVNQTKMTTPTEILDTFQLPRYNEIITKLSKMSNSAKKQQRKWTISCEHLLHGT